VTIGLSNRATDAAMSRSSSRVYISPPAMSPPG